MRWTHSPLAKGRTMSVSKELAGYCGLYCGACDIYRLSQEGKRTGKAPAFSDLPERFQKVLPKDAALECEGCRSAQVYAGCSRCPLQDCAKKKGLEGFCPDCSSYPCMRTRLFGWFAKLFGFEKKLPHQTEKKVNLRRIAEVGMDAWLEEQEKKWRCPDCGTPYSWYLSTCVKCGRDLDGLKGYLRD